jgi:hypothetical protein
MPNQRTGTSLWAFLLITIVLLATTKVSQGLSENGAQHHTHVLPDVSLTLAGFGCKLT